MASRGAGTRSQYPGKPLNVIVVEEDPDDPKGKRRVKVNEEALKELMQNIQELERKGVKQLSIVSLLGAFRTGKSFMLDLFIRYLSNEVTDSSRIRDSWDQEGRIDVYSTTHKCWCKGVIKDIGATGNSRDNLTVTYKLDNGNEEPVYYEKDCKRDDPALRPRRDHEDLIFGKDANFGDGDHEQLFRWRSQEDRCTTGIWFYSHPFIRKTPRGGRVGIILMDTQGLFDPLSPPQINNAIFGLTTLLSSYQILNVQGRIQQNTLEELHFFIEFAHSAISRFFNENREQKDDEDDTANNDEEKQQANRFHTLEFLVRDWQNYSDPNDIQLCLKENEASLDKAFARHFDDNGARERIETSFERVSCFMLPHPGMKMVSKQWKGDPEAIEADFKNLTTHFVERIFDKDVAIKKDLASKEDLTVSMFEHYIRQFTEAFSDGKLPQAVGMVKAWATAVNLNAKDEALTEFQVEMDKKVGPKCTYIDEDKFEELEERVRRQASEVFSLKAQYGPEEDREKTRVQFDEEIDRRINNYREANENRVDRILASWSFVALIAIVAFLIDFASDYICDWWLPVCSEGSKLLKMIYSIIFGAIGMQLFFLARSARHSRQTVIRAGLGLFGETMAQAGTYADSYDLKRYLGPLGSFMGTYQTNEQKDSDEAAGGSEEAVQATNTTARSDGTQYRRKRKSPDAKKRD